MNIIVGLNVQNVNNNLKKYKYLDNWNFKP